MRTRKIAIWVGVALGGVLLLQGGCTLSHMQYRRDFIPAKIATGLFYVDGNCGDLITFEGAYAYNLKRETIAALRREGLRFFDDIDALGNAPVRYYFSGVWRPTPVPGPDGEGLVGDTSCAMERDWRWPPGLREAMRRPGGYYQTQGGRALIVLPEQGYVIAVPFDR